MLLDLRCPHVWPMQLWWETPNAAYMMRQHFFANLYDRLSTRPFLTALEKVRHSCILKVDYSVGGL
jgi:phosphoinositide-3-kinase regulatory subunit 4